MFQQARVYNGYPYTLDNNGENLHINLTASSEEDVAEYLGEYICRGQATGTSATATYVFNIKGYQPPAGKYSYS